MADKCECVRCRTCHGFGTIHDPFDYGPYSGIDKTCEDCDGSGLTYECDFCMWIAEEEYERSLVGDRQ